MNRWTGDGCSQIFSCRIKLKAENTEKIVAPGHMARGDFKKQRNTGIDREKALPKGTKKDGVHDEFLLKRKNKNAYV